MAATTESILRHAGWQVDTATDGEGALALARGGDHQVVLLDLQLPKLSGLDILEAVQWGHRPPAVIVMSGYLDVSNTRRALDHGAVEVLEKPVRPQRLISIIEDVEARWLALANNPCTEKLSNLGGGDVPELLGRSPAARLLREQTTTVSGYRDLPVMVIGETGTGKELVAQAIHRMSSGDGRLVAINCAAVTDELFESELFGHEAGAFSGARGTRRGLLEEAGHGTVFLDEVGELPATQQAKLLRVLETRTFRRVGSNTEIPLRARIVSATNRRLRGGEDELMRPDLFFRLAGFTINTPPLRERMEDIDILARHFLCQFSTTYRSSEMELSSRALDALRTHAWPGNVRELRSVTLYAAVCANASVIGVRHIVEALRAREASAEPEHVRVPAPAQAVSNTLPDVERELILKSYSACGGNITTAARNLGIPRTTLRDKLRRFGVR